MEYDGQRHRMVVFNGATDPIVIIKMGPERKNPTPSPDAFSFNLRHTYEPSVVTIYNTHGATAGTGDLR